MAAVTVPDPTAGLPFGGRGSEVAVTFFGGGPDILFPELRWVGGGSGGCSQETLASGGGQFATLGHMGSGK